MKVDEVDRAETKTVMKFVKFNDEFVGPQTYSAQIIIYSILINDFLEIIEGFNAQTC